MARRKSTAYPGDAFPPPPPMPEKTPEEIAQSAEISRLLQELTVTVVQRNLDNAVLLAQMAARHRGPLVDHFAELGRRYVHLLREPQGPALRVIKGGGD